MGMFESIGRSIDQSIDSVKEIATDLGKGAKESINRAGEKIEEVGRGIAEGAKETARNVNNWKNEKIAAGKKAFNEGIENVKEVAGIVKAKGEKVIETAGAYGEQAAMIMLGATMTLGENMADIAYNAGKGVLEITLKTGEVINVNVIQPGIKTAEVGAKVVQRAIDIQLGVTMATYELLAELGEGVAESTAKYMTKAAQRIEKVGKWGMKATEAAIKTVREAGSEAYQAYRIVSAAAKALPGQIGDVVYDKGKQAVVFTLNGGKKVMYKIENATEHGYNVIVTNLKRFEEKGRQTRTGMVGGNMIARSR